MSNTVSSTAVSDNGCNGTVKYQFCKSTSDSTSNCSSSNISSWLSTTGYTFNSLSDGTKYYYFVRTQDGLGNTSDWSSSTSSTQDNTAPAISFDKNSGVAANSHSVVVTASDSTSKLAASQKIKYRWQTDSTCSTTGSQYTEVALSPTAA